MPQTEVRFYADDDEASPAVDWMADEIPDKAALKLTEKIERLRAEGHQLRRPHADYLRDGIHELRVRHANVHYRLLYFFYKNIAAVISHGCTKEDRVPPREIDAAIENKKAFEKDPEAHTYVEKQDEI